MVTLARLCNSLSTTTIVMFLDQNTVLVKHCWKAHYDLTRQRNFDACRGGNTSGLDPARASQQPKVAQIRIASSAERAPDHSSKSFVTSCSHGSAGARPGLM